jgi:FtsP/CotA-like multicopper oxidase with cupredoxin domain
VNITRRILLKTGLTGTALSWLYTPLVSFSQTGEKPAVREFSFSASRARVNLGSGPDFWAWTYNGKLPEPGIRVKEEEIVRNILKNFLPEETSIFY